MIARFRHLRAQWGLAFALRTVLVPVVLVVIAAALLVVESPAMLIASLFGLLAPGLGREFLVEHSERVGRVLHWAGLVIGGLTMVVGVARDLVALPMDPVLSVLFFAVQAYCSSAWWVMSDPRIVRVT